MEDMSGVWEVNETLAVVVAEVFWCTVVDVGLTDVDGLAWFVLATDALVDCTVFGFSVSEKETEKEKHKEHDSKHIRVR